MNVAIVVLIAALASACRRDGPPATGEVWPEADELFRHDARWVGGDGAYSIDLGNDRVLWLFGDTFLARTTARSRDDADFIRNSVAIQTGYDPSHALMRFYWPERASDGAPSSFYPEDGSDWFWPKHGVRIDDELVIFWEREHQPDGTLAGPDAFASQGWTASLVSNPDAEPSAWMWAPATLPTTPWGDVTFGEAVVREGDDVFVYIGGGSSHRLYVARYAASAVHDGKLDAPLYWYGDARGWAMGTDEPEDIVALGEPEVSVHHDARTDQWLMGETQGYGATTLALRSAPHAEGPWSEPRDVLRPPMSFAPDAFVYAGKAHPELLGADLVMTYVPSTFADIDTTADSPLYYPHFVRVGLR